MRRVVIGLKGDAVEQELLDWVSHHLRRTSVLWLVTAMGRPPKCAPALAERMDSILRRRAAENAAAAAAALRQAGFTAVYTVADYGGAPKMLLAVAEKVEADLILLGRPRSSGFRLIRRPLVQRIIDDGRFALLVAGPGPRCGNHAAPR
jgi:nucleotide-binding universal stress UspA family protein